MPQTPETKNPHFYLRISSLKFLEHMGHCAFCDIELSRKGSDAMLCALCCEMLLAVATDYFLALDAAESQEPF